MYFTQLTGDAFHYPFSSNRSLLRQRCSSRVIFSLLYDRCQKRSDVCRLVKVGSVCQVQQKQLHTCATLLRRPSVFVSERNRQQNT